MMNIMGTRLDVVMTGDFELLSEVWQQINAETERLHCMLNRFDAKSDISRINRDAKNAPVELNDELLGILTELKKYHQHTFGYFDVSLRDFNLVIVDDDRKTVRFAQKDISLDLGGYAKGYALQRIQEILLQAGVTQALINFGNSSILALGSHPHGQYWGIEIETRSEPKIYKLHNQSMSVSGNTAQHTEHIINPATGKYTSERKIVTVVSNNPVEAEVLSTALMVTDEKSFFLLKKMYCDTIIDIFYG